MDDCILKLATFDLALSPAERFGSLVVPPEESFNGFTQLIFRLEASAVECLALEQAEHDFNLVQPTGRSRREVKLDASLEFPQPVVVSFMRRVVVEDDVEFPVLRMIRQHAIQEGTKVLPLLEFGELRVNLASLDFESGKQIQRAVTLVSALQRAHDFAAVGLHIAGGPFDRLDAGFLIHAQYHGV